MRLAIVTIALLLGTGCVPEFLAKYRRDPLAPQVLERSSPNTPASSEQASRPPARPPAIYPLDKGQYRFLVPFDQVWDAALSVIMKNYNITIVDRENGIISTEWDSFYLKSQLYRNKVSFRVKSAGHNTVEVSVYNNVEALKAARPNENAVWSPHDKGIEEVDRLIYNMALVLRQEPPQASNEVAAGQMEERATISR